MTDIEWVDWAAIYCAGYIAARKQDDNLTAEVLHQAWDEYQAKRPRLQDTDPRNPEQVAYRCVSEDLRERVANCTWPDCSCPKTFGADACTDPHPPIVMG